MNLISAINHLFFPRVCPGCGSDALTKDDIICYACFHNLPFTRFNTVRDNKTEKIFYGRISISLGMSLLCFSKNSLVQNLLHEMKYRGNRELGVFLGRLMGRSLMEEHSFNDIDCIIPLPLSEKKKKRRGYNQSELLCDGISQIIKKSVLKEFVIRTVDTSTQTKKHRKERWQNVEGIFHVKDQKFFENKHILLVDDVLTTGATLEACASSILQSSKTRVSIATLAIATN